LRIAAAAVAIKQQQTKQLVFTLARIAGNGPDYQRLLAAKYHRRETLLRRTEQQCITAGTILGQPLALTKMTRNDQAGAPTESLQHAFVFPEYGRRSGH